MELEHAQQRQVPDSGVGFDGPVRRPAASTAHLKASNNDPLPVGSAASPGDKREYARWNHVHAAVPPEGGPPFEAGECDSGFPFTHILVAKKDGDTWTMCWVPASRICDYCCLWYVVRHKGYDATGCSGSEGWLDDCTVECLTVAEAATVFSACYEPVEGDPYYGAVASWKVIQVAGPFATEAEALAEQAVNATCAEA